jgi:hypothetical protein
MIHKLKKIVTCVLMVGVLALMLAAPAAANGAPIKIFLSYLPETSNFGPTGAAGEALVSIGEAWVDLKVTGLPQLTGEHYEAWLVTANTEDMISLGTFNANAQGQVAYYQEFEDLPVVEYRYFIITIEPDQDADPAADERRSVAGVFPNTRIEIISGTPTPTLEPGVTPTPGAPGTLPVTGIVAGGGALALLGLAAAGLGLAALLLKRN